MKRNYNKRNKYVLILLFIIMLYVIFLATGFSAFQASIGIDDVSVVIRSQKDVRITNILLQSVTNGATVLDYDYSVGSINGLVTLPNSNSSVNFQVEVTNIGNVEVGFSEINILDSNLDYEIVGYDEGTKLCDDDDSMQCKLASVTTFNVIIKYASGASVTNNEIHFAGNFNFKEAYDVIYLNIAGTNNFPSVILNGEPLIVTFETDVPYDLKIIRSDGGILGNYTYVTSLNNSNHKVLTIPYVTSSLTIDRYYPITYILNGGTNDSNNPTKYLTSDDIRFNDPTHNNNNYTFSGWYETNDFSSSVITSTNQLSGSATLYAKWVDATILYTINYNLNGGTQANGQVTSYYASSPQNILVPTRSNYTFAGWYTNSSYTGASVTSTNQLDGDTTLYAKWTATIIYIAGSGSSIAPTTYVYGVQQSIPTTTNQHDAQFVNWHLSSTSGSVVTSTSQLAGNATLYAEWTDTVSSANYNDGDYTFYITNASDLGSYNNFSRNAIYTESSAHCVVNRIKVTLTISYDHKTATLPVNITDGSGNIIGTSNISITNGATLVETTVTLNTPVQIGSGFTLKFGSFSGNTNKLRVNNISFIVNP